MCNDYAREIEAGRVIKLLREMENVPAFEWEGGRFPNDVRPQPHIKINDKGLVVRLRDRRLAGTMMPWAWKTPTGKPVWYINLCKTRVSKGSTDTSLPMVSARS